jgi:hypothetical protein
MLDLSKLDLEEIAAALADQTDYEHRWLINPQTGEIVFWTADGGIDGHTPIDLDDLDLLAIGPLPSYIWYEPPSPPGSAPAVPGVGQGLPRLPATRGPVRRTSW